MKTYKYSLLLIVILLLTGCDVSDSNDPEISGDWLIKKSEIFDGGPGKDGIPSLTTPEFISVSSINYLSDNDLVIGVKNGSEVKAYPHPILDWHEIINDDVDGLKLAVTYCPLTGSAIAWNRVINNKVTTFGVSGLLFNTNLIPYDRSTNSNWSQMMMLSVNGSLIGTSAETYHVVETKWSTWKAMYPSSKVVSTNTGHSRNYGNYPYGDYRTNHGVLLFPVSNNDGRLSRKERVLGVLGNSTAKAYRISSFQGGTSLVNDNLGGKSIVVAGNSQKNFIVAFERTIDSGTVLEFSPVQNELPIILLDNEGNKWDLFGIAVEGPRQGQSLTPTISYIAYWFAWAAFYPQTDLYTN